MPSITELARRMFTTGDQTPGRDLPEDVRQALPRRFEAVGESLASGVEVTGACEVAGRAVARDGADLGEALSGLRVTYETVTGGPPTFEATQALSVAWSEATLEFLHQLSCEDPLTGLASLAHVRTRLAELYREAEQTGGSVQAGHALVVVQLAEGAGEGAGDAREHHFTRALRLVQVAEATRAVFSGGETVGKVGAARAVAVVRRTPDLGASVALLREFLGDLDLGPSVVRVWIEGLPALSDSATRLLDDLAR